MDYGFYLFGLLMVFLLIIFYFLKRDNFTRLDKVFRSLLLVTHLIQISCVLIYTEVRIGNGTEIIFGKVYLIMAMLWFGLLSFYYILFLLKDKYKKDDNKFKSGFKELLLVFIAIQLMGVIGILLSPVVINNYMVNCFGNFVIYFIYFYLGIDILVLLMGLKRKENKFYYHLVIIFMIQLIMLYFQSRSMEIPIFDIGIIFITFYIYFIQEHIEKSKLASLKLERDYARRQSIDKSEFLKVLSHEIRIPLNTIDGFSQVILDSDNLDSIKDDVQDIRMASNDLIDVINGMIDLSIIESGRLEIIEENYNVYDMFDNIVSIAQSKMKEKEVEFKFLIDDDIPKILFGDSERISQIVLNLITNSIKFTDNGMIELKVQSVRTSSKCRLKISVKDTGRGIKSEDLGTIFDGKAKKEGITLGLAVSKHLIELMGGNIDVDSIWDKGSTFVVTVDQVVVSEHQEGKTTKAKILRPFKASGKRILLVDDNKLNLKVASKLLQPYDVEIVEVQSGKDCLDILDNDHNFDLILMDDLMPEMSGTECLDVLKKIERVDGYYIPVVVLTANAVNGMREKYLGVGFEDYLAKPIDKYELDRILKKYLKGKK